MAITIDQASIGEFASDTAGTTAQITTTQNVASGGFIILACTCLDTQSISSFSGGGLTWTIDKQGTGLGSIRLAIASAQAPSGLASGTTLTANYSASTPGARSLCGTSFLGVVTSSPVDGTPDNKGFSSTTAWTSNGMTIQAGSAIVAAAGNSTNLLTSTPTNPLIEAHDFGNGGFSQTVGYQIQASAGTYTSAGTWSSAASGTVNAVAYKAAAGSAVAFLVYGHTGLDRLANIEAYLKANNTGWLPFTATGLDRITNIEAVLTGTPVNSVTFLPYGKTGTDRLWNIESYLLAASSSSG